MRFSKLLATFVVLLFFSVPANFAFGFPENPPTVTADAAIGGGGVVTVSGTVDDENVNTVTVKILMGGGGPLTEIPVNVVGGAFTVDVHVALGATSLIVKAIDEDGLSDTEIIDLEF